MLPTNSRGIVRGLTSQTCGSNSLLSTALKSRHAVSGLKQSPCSDVLHCLQQVGQALGGVAGTSHLLSRWSLTHDIMLFPVYIYRYNQFYMHRQEGILPCKCPPLKVALLHSKLSRRRSMSVSAALNKGNANCQPVWKAV